MVLSYTQEQIINEMLLKAKKKYPPAEILNISASPEDPSDVLVFYKAPEDEDNEIKLQKYMAKIASEVLEKYGYLIIFSPKNSRDIN